MVELNQRIRGGIQETQERRSSNGSHKLSHWHRPIGSEKHTSCSASMLTVTCVWVRREESVEHGEARSSPVGPCRRETLACGPGPGETEALSLSDTLWSPHIDHQLVAPFRSITVPQTQKQDETSGARRTQKEVWDFLDCFQELGKASCSVLGGKKKSFICVVCIYCLHNDATFKGYRNMYEFQV